MNRRKTQKELVAAYLRRGKSLTPLPALRMFGTLRLGAIIFVLKAEGMEINSKMVKVSKGTYVKQYWKRKR